MRWRALLSAPASTALISQPWTYDSDTASQYTGQRGDNYWETETYTETDANGNQVTRTRQVQRTRWTWVSGQVANITFKHALLPLWISAYRYQERVFRFLVNARSGEVQGERPFSVLKIALAVLAAILAIVLIAFLAHSH